MALKQEKPASDLGRRLKTIIIALPPVIVAIILPAAVTWLVVTLACVVALIEVLRIAGDEPNWYVPWMFYVAAVVAALWLIRYYWGPGALLFTLMVAFFGDTAAYLVGRKLGGRKLWWRISPKKTRAGAVAGLVGSWLAVPVAMLGVFSQIGWVLGTLVALAGGVVGQGGDLFESWFKRKHGVKDSGNFFPGHGGMLDRIDALMPVGILVFLVLSFT